MAEAAANGLPHTTNADDSGDQAPVFIREALEYWAAVSADHRAKTKDGKPLTAFALHSIGEERPRHTMTELTYEQLFAEARRIGWLLVNGVGLRKGDRAVIFIGHSLDFVLALVSCLWYGIVAIPVDVGNLDDASDPHFKAIQTIFDQIKPDALIFNEASHAMLEHPTCCTSSLPKCTFKQINLSAFLMVRDDRSNEAIVHMSDIPALFDGPAGEQMDVGERDDALILFNDINHRLTMITHDQLRVIMCAYASAIAVDDREEAKLVQGRLKFNIDSANEVTDMGAWRPYKMLRELHARRSMHLLTCQPDRLHRAYTERQTLSRYATGHSVRLFSWLPLHFGSGLMYFILTSLFFGFECHLTSPDTFWRSPTFFLDIVSRFRCSVMSMPVGGMTRVIKTMLLEKAGADRDREQVSPVGPLNFINQGGFLTDARADGNRPIQFLARLDVQRLLHNVEASGCALPSSLVPLYLSSDTGAPLTRWPIQTPPQQQGRTPLSINTGPQAVIIDVRALAENGRVKVLASCGLFCGEVEELNGGENVVARRFVSQGPPMEGVDIRIVNPFTKEECQPYVAGEIYVRARTTPTYFDHGKRVFFTMQKIRIRDKDGESMTESLFYFRTCDVGFLHQGELYVLGPTSRLVFLDYQIAHSHLIKHAISTTPGHLASIARLVLDVEAFTIFPDSRRSCSWRHAVAWITIDDSQLRELPDKLSKLELICEHLRQCISSATAIRLGAILLTDSGLSHLDVLLDQRREPDDSDTCVPWWLALIHLATTHERQCPTTAWLQIFDDVMPQHVKSKNVPSEVWHAAMVSLLEIWQEEVREQRGLTVQRDHFEPHFHMPHLLDAVNKWSDEIKHQCRRLFDGTAPGDFEYIFTTQWQWRRPAAVQVLQFYFCWIVAVSRCLSQEAQRVGLIGMTPDATRSLIHAMAEKADNSHPFYHRELTKAQWDSVLAGLTRIFGPSKLCIKIERDKFDKDRDKDKKTKDKGERDKLDKAASNLVLRLPCPTPLHRLLLHADTTKASGVYECAFKPLNTKTFQLVVMLRNVMVTLLNAKVELINMVLACCHGKDDTADPRVAPVQLPFFPCEPEALDLLFQADKPDIERFSKKVGDVNQPMTDDQVLARTIAVLGHGASADFLGVEADMDSVRMATAWVRELRRHMRDSHQDGI
ncbi:unnamed protein product [Vitrella brassicaformis CCMP3155]|uniref:AMP-dependent synthetase/ligase domain-containing protein n=3 Tax=Vitrella brassicaformis TaxID=1169539 RepID=A0A0G4G4V5_VITBC|nr:unnamed protein product [Vitrella brassicaformis CCMP3155]|eukprot:CEM23349.1 unnamed protein product [Vitrella brassicaformis CCMP3155]